MVPARYSESPLFQKLRSGLGLAIELGSATSKPKLVCGQLRHCRKGGGAGGKAIVLLRKL